MKKYRSTITYVVEIEAESSQQAWEIIQDSTLPNYVPDTLETEFPVEQS